MNVKNLNPLERHIEKIVLAVAAAGALFIGYLAIQPITIPDTDVKAVDVEPKVTAAVEELDAKRAEVAQKGNLTPPLKRYDQAYIDTVTKEPIPKDTLLAAIPPFAPKNVAVERFTVTPNTLNDGNQVVTPTVPAPTDLTTSGNLYVVYDSTGLDAQGNPLPSPAVPTTHNVTVVDVNGLFPLAAFTAQMNDPALTSRQAIPPDQRRSVIYRIEVSRRERVNGTWTDFTPVTPSKVGGDLPIVDFDNLPDANIPTTFTAIDALFKTIVEPDFYAMPNGQTLTHQIMPKVKAMLALPPVVPGAVPGAPGALVRPVAPPAPVSDDSEGAANPAAPLSPDVAAMKALPKVPFWFYDETAVGGHEYQYEVRVAMLNPTFHPNFTLQNPAMAKAPLLYSPWTLVGSPITVPAEEYFFISSVLGNTRNAQSVSARFFKWVNGKWCSGEHAVQLGGPVTGTVSVLSTPTTIASSLEVKTNFTLVDVSTSGPDIEAILLNPTGQLVRRSSADTKSGTPSGDLYSKLNTLSQPPKPVPATLPAPSTTVIPNQPSSRNPAPPEQP